MEPRSISLRTDKSPRGTGNPGWGRAKNISFYGLTCVVFTYLESVAAIEDFRQKGGDNIWEPIVWSGTSVFVIVALSYGIFYFTKAFPITREHWLRRLGMHAVASMVFSLVHILAMYGLRLMIYSIVGHDYSMMDFSKIFAYEYSKDIVTYVVIVLLSHLILLWRHMNQARIKALSLEADLAQLKLRRLQEQLRPHFLFNTLNHISSCMYEDVERADKLLADLSALLRYSLKADHLLTVPLQEELEFLSLYLNLMNQRFSGRIETHLDVDEQLLIALVPRFLLQPLVENAIQHGFQERDGAGRIEIRIFEKEERLVIEVIDDGMGLKTDVNEGVVHGHGLGNILGILEQCHPNAAALSMTPNPEGGLCVRIEMPFVTQAPAETETNAKREA